MKKNKTKSILVCAVLASVLGAAAPVWANEGNEPLNISCTNLEGAAYGVVNGLPGALILAEGESDATGYGDVYLSDQQDSAREFKHEPLWVISTGFTHRQYLAGDFKSKVVIIDHPNGIKSDVYKITGIGTVPCGRTDSISSLTSSIFNPDGSTLILDNVGNITVTGKSADSRAVLTMGNGALTYLNFANEGGITMNITDKKPDGQFNYYVAEGRDNSLTVLRNLDKVTINGETVPVDEDFWQCLKTTGGAQIVVVNDSGNVVAADADHWGTGPEYGKEIGHFYRTIANKKKTDVQSLTVLGFDDKNVVALKANKADASATFGVLNGSLRSVNFGTGDACAVSATGGKTATLTDVSSVNVNALDGNANFISVSDGGNISVNGKDNWATVDVKSEKNDANFVFAKDGTNTVNVTGVDAMLYPGAEGKAYVAHVKAGETTLNLTDSSVSGNLNTALVGIPVVSAELGTQSDSYATIYPAGGGEAYVIWVEDPLPWDGVADETKMNPATFRLGIKDPAATGAYVRHIGHTEYDDDLQMWLLTRQSGRQYIPLQRANDAAQGALEAVYVGTAQNSVQNLLDALDTALEAVQKAINSDGDLQKLIDTTRDALEKVEHDVDEMKELWENNETLQNVPGWVKDAQSALKTAQDLLDYYNSHTDLISVMAGGWQGWWLKIKPNLNDVLRPLLDVQKAVQTGTAQNVTQKFSYVLYQLGYYTPAYVQVEKGATLNLNLDNSLLQAGINSTEEHGTVNLTMKESNWVMQDDSNVDYLKMDDKSEVIFDRDSYKYLTLNVGNYEGNGNFILSADLGYSGIISDKLVIDKAEEGSALNLYLLTEDNPLLDPDTKAEILALGKDAEDLPINFIADNLPDNGLWRYALNTEKNNEGTTFSFGLKRGDELSTVGRAVTGGVIDSQVWYQESDAVFDRVRSTAGPLSAHKGVELCPVDTRGTACGGGVSNYAENSVWASYTHSKNTYDNSIKAITSVANQGGIEKRYNGAVVGYDKCIATYPEHNAALYMGGLIGYGEGRNSWSGGNSELDGKGIGIYAGYKTHKGAYLTALAKYNQYNMDVKGYGYNDVKDDYRLHSFGVSVNAGRRYAKDLNKGFYVEPQAELGYVNYGNDNYELRGIKVEMQETKSCRGRLGLQFGTHNGRADVYGRVSYLKDFQGDSDIMTHYLNGTRDSIKVEQGGHWWNFALGGTFTNGKNLSADMSVNLDRGDHDSKLGFRVGLNWMF